MKKEIYYVYDYLNDYALNKIIKGDIPYYIYDSNSFLCDWFCSYRISNNDDSILSAVNFLHKNGKSVYTISVDLYEFDIDRFKSLGFDGVCLEFNELLDEDSIEVIKKFYNNGIKIMVYSCRWEYFYCHLELINEIKDYVDIFIFDVSYLDFTRNIDKIIELKNDLNLNVGLDIIAKHSAWNDEIVSDFNEDYQNNAYLWELDYNDIMNDDYIKNYCSNRPEDFINDLYRHLLFPKYIYKCLENNIITFLDNHPRDLLNYCVNCYEYNNNDIRKDAVKIKVLEFDGKKFAAKSVKYSSIDFSKKYSSVSFKDISKINSDGFNTLSYEKVEKDDNYGIDEKHHPEDTSLVGLKSYLIFYEENNNTANNDVNLMGADKLVFDADDDIDLSDNARLDVTLNNNVSEEDTIDEDTYEVEEDNSKKSVRVIDKFIALFKKKDNTLDDNVNDLEEDITLIDDEEDATDEDTYEVEEDNSKKSVGVIGKFKTLFKRKDNTLDDNVNDLEEDIILNDNEDTTDEDTYEVDEDNSKKSVRVIDKFIALFKKKDNTLDDNVNDLEEDITLIDDEEDAADEDADEVDEDNSKKSVGVIDKFIALFKKKDNTLDDNVNDLEEDITLIDDEEDATDEDADVVEEDNEKGSNEGIFTKIKNKVIQLLKRNDISDEEIESRKYRSNIDDDYIDINDYCSNNDEDADVVEEDNNNRLRIVSSKKSKNKTSLKKKIVAASIALGIVLSATVVGVCCFINNKDKDEDNLSNDSIVDDLTYDFSFIINDELTKKVIENYNNLHNKDVKEETNDNKDNYQDVSNVSDNKQENNVFEIGDTVTVQAKYIYDNVYDAMNRTNGYNPYFGNSKEREVKGVFVELNDSYSYYENQEDIDAALSEGGIVRSYVVGNSDGYEGAYNSLDVKSLQKVGNRL